MRLNTRNHKKLLPKAPQKEAGMASTLGKQEMPCFKFWKSKILEFREFYCFMRRNGMQHILIGFLYICAFLL